MKKIYCLALLALGAACSSDKDGGKDADKSVVMSTDFESMLGWVPDGGTVSKDRSHSGKYALKVDDKHEFSLTYITPMADLTLRRPKALRLEAWAYMDSPQSTAQLGLVVVDPTTGQNSFGSGIDLKEQVTEPKKWVKISKEIALPATVLPNHQLKIYLWRAGASTPAYLDDLSLAVVE